MVGGVVGEFRLGEQGGESKDGVEGVDSKGAVEEVATDGNVELHPVNAIVNEFTDEQSFLRLFYRALNMLEYS